MSQTRLRELFNCAKLAKEIGQLSPDGLLVISKDSAAKVTDIDKETFGAVKCTTTTTATGNLSCSSNATQEETSNNNGTLLIF